MMHQKQVKISDIIIEKYLPIFNDKKYRHIILTSGRAGTKSSYAAIKADYQIVSDSSGSVVVLRKHHNKLRKTVYKEMLRGVNRLGLAKGMFDISKSPMEIRYKETEATIYFSGSDGIDDTKGIIDEDRPIKLVVIDELTEFFTHGEGADELQNIEATFIRGNNEGFQTIYLYNPPKNPNAPINAWCRNMEQRDDCIHIHTDYRDVPVEWIGNELVKSAEIMKEIDERQYRWVWLGESVGVDDLVYYMFSEKHKELPKAEKYRIIGIGIDYGQQNATTYQFFGINVRDEKLEGLYEYYHSGRETGKQKSPSEYAKDFIKLTNELHDKYLCSIFYAFIDPSAKGLAEEIKRAARDVKYQIVVKDAENAVALGISRVQKLLTFEKITISPKQKNLIKEFGLYEYDSKSIERGKEVPVKENDHCMDAIRYCVMGLWKKLKQYLPREEREDDEYI